MLMVALVVIVVSLLLLFLIKKPTKLPPGPSTWQIMRRASEFGKRPHAALRDLAKEHGPLMTLRLGSQVVIIASSAAAAKEILQTQDRNLSGRYVPWLYNSFPEVEQTAIALSPDCSDRWRFLRGVTQNCVFSAKSIDSRADMRKAKVAEMVRYLRSRQLGRVVKLDDLIESTIYNIISDILVSRDLFDIERSEDEDEDGKNVKALVQEIIETVSSSLGLFDLFPILRKLDCGTKGKATELCRKITRVWEDIIEERRSSANYNSSSSTPRDFLDALLENAVPDRQICMIVMEILAAGMDSSRITTTWLMVELVKSPLILRRVREEIAGAFEGDAVINESILTESVFFQACIKEALRLHISTPLLIPHHAVEACKIDDYVIPRDSIVVVNAWAISMDPESWRDAETFDPERFLVGPKIDFRGNHFEYIPFGAGRRMCPGSNLAIKNVQILVASLVHYFDWSLPDGADPTGIDTADKFGTVLKRDKPLHLVPSLRNLC